MVSLELPAPARVRVGVFDVMGREVWSREAEQPAGRSELTWSLADRKGSRVPNGVYLARVSVAGSTRTTRFVVVD